MQLLEVAELYTKDCIGFSLQSLVVSLTGVFMYFPEQKPEKYRQQILDDEDGPVAATLRALEKENRSLKELLVQFSKIVIQKITGKK